MSITTSTLCDPQVLPISAPTPELLEKATEDLLQSLRKSLKPNLLDLARTLQKNPQNSVRRILVCGSIEEAVAMLEKRKNTPRRIYTNKRGCPVNRPPVVFMFPGQGAQYVEMGRGLYEQESVFRDCFDSCVNMVKSITEIDLKAAIFPSAHTKKTAADKLRQTATTQPALFAIEYALAQLWISKGIHPDAMIGHSIGEYTAACVSGVFSQQDALELICHRASLMQSMPKGVMAILQTQADEATTLIANSDTCIASLNAPNTCVISGTGESVDAILRRAEKLNISFQRLRTSHAFHSPMMQPAKEALIKNANMISTHAPEIPFISNLTGTWFTEDNARNPSYWGEHLRNAIRFSEGIAELMNHAPYIFIEVGPGNSLCVLARQHMSNPSATRTIPSLRHAKEDHRDDMFFATAIGKCWLAGVPVEWPHLAP